MIPGPYLIVSVAFYYGILLCCYVYTKTRWDKPPLVRQMALQHCETKAIWVSVLAFYSFVIVPQKMMNHKL